jgi:hypothetical protein
MRTSSARRHLVVLAATLGLLIAGAGAAAAAVRAEAANPGIGPHGARYDWLTYAQWEARWWQWAFSIPADANHPFSPGGNTLQNQTGHVWFVATVVGGTEVRSITVPPGTALFFPVVNVECSSLEADPFHGDDPAARSACANGHIDETSGMTATIDGTPVRGLDAYRGESPDFAFGPLPDPNVIGAPAGSAGRSTDAGIYLLLTPLAVGRHTIHLTGTFDEFGVSIDTAYTVTVAPERGALP